MNEENLVPLTKRVQREKREIQSKGGKASVQVRKQKKSMRETFMALLETDAKDRKDVEKLKKYGEEKSNQMLLAVSMFELVKEKGYKSVDAFKEIMEIIGENGSQGAQESQDFNNLIGAIENVRKAKREAK